MTKNKILANKIVKIKNFKYLG